MYSLYENFYYSTNFYYLVVSKMSREASYHWSFHSQVYPSSSVFLPPPPAKKKKICEQNLEILNLINAARPVLVPSYFCVIKNKMRSFWLVEREQC